MGISSFRQNAPDERVLVTENRNHNAVPLVTTILDSPEIYEPAANYTLFQLHRFDDEQIL